jgi:beta-glucanase (GH16 family)
VAFLLLAGSAEAQNWQLVWSDEFNGAQGTLPDQTKWSYDDPHAGSGNQELETYCGLTGAGQTGICADWQQNAQMDGQGHLVISAINSGLGWTSARLLSLGKFSFTYGRAEASIKLPTGRGIWPAFWMMGTDITSVGWPNCGEIDVMENVLNGLGPSVTRSTVHGPGYSGAGGIGYSYNFPSGQRIDTDYHTYGVIWSPDLIQFYVDDYTHPFFSVRPSDIPAGTHWVFNDQPFFMLLNLAMGGSWPGPPDSSTPNPARMFVDYVRVYSPAESLRFVPVTPCRVVDTRGPSGAFGGPTMTAGSTRSFAIPQSGCGIPSTAQAYSLNVTVVPQGPLSYLTLWPAGQARPFVSTLNSWAGAVAANAAIVPAGADGAVSVYATNPTDVILDINGYFDSSSGPGWYAFYPVTPCRVADTRGVSGTFGGPEMSAGESRDFPIPSSSCGVPPTATAYSLNVTVVPDAAVHYLGYLTTWPAGQGRPNVSTLNSWTGKVVANAALVPAGTNEAISVFVSNPTDVILDINGYFGLPGSAGALSFYPVTPCRIADTRNPAGPFGGPVMEAGATRSFTIPESRCNIPATAAAYSLNVTVVPDGALQYLTAWPSESAQPFVSTLNSWDGTVVANAAIVPAGTGGAISVFVTNRTHVILDINGYFAPSE